MPIKADALPYAIREAGEADYSAIYDLQLKAYSTEDLLYDYTIPPLLQQREEAVADCRRADLVLAALNPKNIIIGSVRGFVENGICFISKLMVDPEWRKMGAGTALLREIELRLPAERWSLFTGLKSRSNITLYQKNGYVITCTDHEKELVYMEKQRNGR